MRIDKRALAGIYAPWAVAHQLTYAPLTAVGPFENMTPSVHVHTPSLAPSLPPSHTWSVQPAASTAARTAAFCAAEYTETSRPEWASQWTCASAHERYVPSTWRAPSGSQGGNGGGKAGGTDGGRVGGEDGGTVGGRDGGKLGGGDGGSGGGEGHE